MVKDGFDMSEIEKRRSKIPGPKKDTTEDDGQLLCPGCKAEVRPGEGLAFTLVYSPGIPLIAVVSLSQQGPPPAIPLLLFQIPHCVKCSQEFTKKMVGFMKGLDLPLKIDIVDKKEGERDAG